ncbi:MAG: glucosamine-6-phosphate deaminase [Bacillota bacterium]|nr:glucosamine-6-phosphate deaminase [Bacillota bacterium]
MEIQVFNDYVELSETAAEIVATEIRNNPEAVLGLATGSTPEGMYARLVEMNRKKEISFKDVITFNLDEYWGLLPEHEQSYHHFMYQHLFGHIDINPDNINIPVCTDVQVDRLCSEYDQKIAMCGGIDLQILGIGINGHIGFNEPSKNLTVFTHLVDLAEETIESNSRFFHNCEEVPRKAITMGMGSIMFSRKILLLASGRSKAEAVRNTVSGKISTEWPASLLQLHHEATLLIDRDAAGLI